MPQHTAKSDRLRLSIDWRKYKENIMFYLRINKCLKGIDIKFIFEIY
ncbi:MAG: hypothetical protein ACJA0H_001887 [Francisellaceae bacterium]|jgi:hypothetical protein